MLMCTAADGIELRLLEEHHAEALAGLADGYDARPQVNEWIFPGDTLGVAQEWIRSELERHARGERVACGIWAEGRLAGVIILDLRGGVLEVDIPRPITASIDYMLAPAFRGRGIMTKTCRALIDYAFRSYPSLNRIEISPDVVNVKSCAVPERLGFTKEGVLRQMVSYGDFTGDIAVYSLLRSEWEARGR
jgi:ribosomal-protein-serine acetyltransferase